MTFFSTTHSLRLCFSSHAGLPSSHNIVAFLLRLSPRRGFWLARRGFLVSLNHRSSTALASSERAPRRLEDNTAFPYVLFFPLTGQPTFNMSSSDDDAPLVKSRSNGSMFIYPARLMPSRSFSFFI